MLWPDLNDDMNRLAIMQVTLSRLRKNLSIFNREQIRIEFADNCYHLHLGEVEYDLIKFEHLVESDKETDLVRAVEIYTTNYLEQEGWLWAEPKKEELFLKYQWLVEQLAQIYLDTKRPMIAVTLISSSIEKGLINEKIFKQYLFGLSLAGNQLDLGYFCPSPRKGILVRTKHANFQDMISFLGYTID